jgi:hypothetical protein
MSACFSRRSPLLPPALLLLPVPPSLENDAGRSRKKALRHSYIQQSFDHYRDEACKWEMMRSKVKLFKVKVTLTPSARAIFQTNTDARTCANRWSFKQHYRSEANAAIRATVVEDLLNNVYYQSAIREVDLPEVERVLESLFNSARAKYNDLSSKDQVFLLNKSLRTKYTSRKSRVSEEEGARGTKSADPVCAED